MDASERERLRALCAEATPGPWTAGRHGPARTAIPALLDALERTERERDEARAEVERLRAALTYFDDRRTEGT